MSWAEAQARQQIYGRGTVYIDPSANTAWGEPAQLKVLSSRVVHKKAGTAELTIVAEGRNFDTPPDEFRITPVELGVNILKHPRYLYALEGANLTEYLVNQMVIRRLQDYFENTTAAMRDYVSKQIVASLGYFGVPYTEPPAIPPDRVYAGEQITGTDYAKRAALEIIQKYWRNEETPMITGVEVSWTKYYYLPQLLNLGGHIEVPWFANWEPLPVQFVSTVEPASLSATVFEILDKVNPQCYSASGQYGGGSSISWLRKPDDVEFQRLWYRHHRVWWGSPVGNWDPDFYSGGDRPLAPGNNAGSAYRVFN